MTAEQHWEEHKIHFTKSQTALHGFIETHDWKYWEEYKAEWKLANKHEGICKAMRTKQYKRLLKSIGS